MITCGRTLQEMCRKPAKGHLVKYYQTGFAYLLSWMVMCMEERTCGLKNIGNVRALSDFKEQCRKYVYCWVQIRGTNSYFPKYFGSGHRKKIHEQYIEMIQKWPMCQLSRLSYFTFLLSFFPILTICSFCSIVNYSIFVSHSSVLFCFVLVMVSGFQTPTILNSSSFFKRVGYIVSDDKYVSQKRIQFEF